MIGTSCRGPGPLARPARPVVAACLLVACALSTPAARAGDSNWRPVPVEATATQIGISGVPGFFVSVGEGGEIIHFDGLGLSGFAGAGTGRLVPSGTSFDLLDVLVLDADFAVASGENVVLLWDGVSWETLVENADPSNPSFLTPVWAPPEKDRLIYQSLGTRVPFFNLVCPLDLADPDAGVFCLAAQGSAVLTLCGTAAEAKVLRTDGSIERYQNGAPSRDAVFTQPATEPLNLIAGWIDPSGCAPGPNPPFSAVAVNAGDPNEFWHFDGRGWEKLGEAGPGELLTGITGAFPPLVLAVGRTTGGAKGTNTGVAWRFDGAAWAPDPLPPGTPGLADAAFAFAFVDEIFADGFEGSGVGRKVALSGAAEMGIVAAGEAGAGGATWLVRDLEELGEFSVGDLALDIELVSPVDATSPLLVGDGVSLRLQVSNVGTIDATGGVVNVDFRPALLRLSETTCSLLENPGGSSTADYERYALPPLAVGESHGCTAVFELREGFAGGDEFGVSGRVGSLPFADGNPANDTAACTFVAADAATVDAARCE